MITRGRENPASPVLRINKIQAIKIINAIGNFMSSIPTSSRAAWLALVTRLHFYIGLFIAPFIFFAALSGTWYVIAPNIEKNLYAEQLYPASDESTRVIFAASGLNTGESRAIFIDPVTLAVLGDMPVYGSSGSLPLRTWLENG